MTISALWMWAAVGAILLAGEMITTSFVLVFFAAAAFVTAVVTTIHPISIEIQLILFAVLGLASLAMGRGWVRRKLLERVGADVASDSNSEFVIDRELAAGAEGTVQYQGAPWTAVNEGAVAARAGDRVRVIRTNGIKLMIQKVER